jgi:putative spermidine/putrescine transport system substrate-binding protein
MKKTLLACTVAASFALPALAQQQLTVVNFGGANANAQKKAYYEPYEKAGTKIIPVEYNGEQAKIKAMVETKKVTWDVVEVESPDAARGCDEGLFEKLDYSKIGSKADFLPAAVPWAVEALDREDQRIERSLKKHAGFAPHACRLAV